ncbi:hypothetical protein JCM14635_18000 [Megalodesulfovibrio paquesii]
MLAGLGSRFFAWWIDTLLHAMLFWILAGGAFLLAIQQELALELTFEMLGEAFFGDFDVPVRMLATLAGWVTLAWVLTGLLYFFVQEYWMGGRTVGKRLLGVRAVMADGRPLTFSAALVRTLCRVFDELVLLWLVPVFSGRNQRLGDMLAGTVVVQEGRHRERSPVRLCEHLLARPAEALRFPVEAARLDRLRSADLEAMIMLLERWDRLTQPQQEALASRLSGNIALALQLPAPVQYQQLIFLEDVLTQALQRLPQQGSS